MMNLNIKATNFELDPKIRDFIEKKVDKIVKKFSKKSETEWKVWVEVEKSRGKNKGDIFRTEIQVVFPGSGKKGIRAEGNGDTWRQAIDKAAKRARRELRDFKEKKTKK